MTVYNQAPALRGSTDNVWSNFSELDTNFNGADITVNKRLSNNWSMTGGASYGKTTGDIYATLTTGDLNNPNNTFREGLVGNDVPYSYRLSGVYELPYADFAQRHRAVLPGLPDTTTVSVGNNTVALTQGTQILTVEPRGTTRLPCRLSRSISA